VTIWSHNLPGVATDDLVFKALADPTRRFLLDRLFARDGRTLTELESEVEMTRFGVMKHLRLLEEAGLVVVRWSGREKRHFLNPVPIRLIHDRWIDKYTERQVSALADLKAELEKKHADNDKQERNDPGLPRGDQGDATGSVGRHHEARVEPAVRLPRPERVRAAAKRDVSGVRKRGDEGVRRSGRDRRR
jgi:DNA-binding transcriptional ArsR family regulator